jgi:hypothetical protein
MTVMRALYLARSVLKFWSTDCLHETFIYIVHSRMVTLHRLVNNKTSSVSIMCEARLHNHCCHGNAVSIK